MVSGSKVLERQFIFIIGAARSGTTWVHRLIADHPQVAALRGVELTVFPRYVAIPVSQYRAERADALAGRWRLGLGAIWDEERFAAHIRGLLSEAYGDVLAARPDATHILDKHPNSSRYVPLIAEWLPQARFVHVIRDGREVAVSAMSVNKRVGHSAGEIGQAARDWDEFTRKAIDAGRLLGDRYLEVRYDRLRSGGVPALRAVFDHCRLPVSDAQLEAVVAANDISRKQYSSGDASLNSLRDRPEAIWRSKLGAIDRYRFDRWAGDLLVQLGYARPGWWADSPIQRTLVHMLAFLYRLLRTTRSIINTWRRTARDPFQPDQA
jgi:hypothetical protein